MIFWPFSVGRPIRSADPRLLAANPAGSKSGDEPKIYRRTIPTPATIKLDNDARSLRLAIREEKAGATEAQHCVGGDLLFLE